MRPTEKLDLILKELYKFRHKDDYFSLDIVIRSARIPLTEDAELKVMATLLAKDSLIEFKDLDFEITARITFDGILFCEKNSYAYPGYPIITHIT